MVKRIQAKEQAAAKPSKLPSSRKHLEPHLFKPGERKVGRQKGTPNKHGVALKECIMTAMEMVGSNKRGKDGAAGYLAHIAWKHPDIFGRLLEKVLPFSLTGAGGGPVQVEYTNREDITLRLKERGLPTPINLLGAPARKVEPIEADYEEVED